MRDGWLLVAGCLLVVFRLWWVVGHQVVYEEGQRVMVTGRVAAEPSVSIWSQQFNLGEFQVSAPRWPEVEYGEKVRVMGTVSLSKQSTQVSHIHSSGTATGFSDSPEIFRARSHEWGPTAREKFGFIRFPEYMQRTLYTLKAENVGVVAEAGWAASVRNKAAEINRRLLPEPQASLLTGVVWGGSQGLPYEFKEAVKKTGTMHVVAASGMNVTMVAGFLIYVLVVVVRRRWAVLAAVVGVWCYVLISGGSASVVRAGIMATIMFTAQFLGRQYLGLRMLVATGILMLIVNPLWLFDLGWQLSVAATTGLLAVGRDTGVLGYQDAKRKSRVVESKGIKLRLLWGLVGGDFSTSVAAVVATLPIMVLGFGRVSLLAPVVNALSLWVVAPLMMLGFVIFFIGMIALPLAQIVGWLAWPLLTYFIRVNEFFGGLPWGSLEGVSLPIWTGVAYYVLLVGAVAWFRRRQAA